MLTKKCISFFLTKCALFFLIIYSNHLTQGHQLRVRGPTNVFIKPKAAHSNSLNGALPTLEPLAFFCQASLGNDLTIVPMIDATFRHNSVKYSSVLSENKLNATFVKEQVNINDAGIWTCTVRTQKADELSQYRYDVSGVTTYNGVEETQISCPVVGYPKPEIVWKISDDDDEYQDIDTPRMSVRNGILYIKNVSDSDDDTYVCLAKNSFTIYGKTYLNDLVIERRLRIKSLLNINNQKFLGQYAWLLPLGIIITCLVLLFTIILFCDIRHRNEQKLVDNEEE